MIKWEVVTTWNAAHWSHLISITIFQHNPQAQLHVTYLGTFHNNEEMEVAVCEWLWVQELDFYHNRIYELALRRGKCINVLMVKYDDT